MMTMGIPRYAIEPIRRERDDDPAITRRMEDAWLAVHGEPLAPIPPPVVGWRLTLNGESNAVVVREFGDGEEGFEQAQREGGDWLRRHDQDGISQWLARAAQASQRMAWDHDYRHHISRRGF